MCPEGDAEPFEIAEDGHDRVRRDLRHAPRIGDQRGQVKHHRRSPALSAASRSRASGVPPASSQDPSDHARKATGEEDGEER